MDHLERRNDQRSTSALWFARVISLSAQEIFFSRLFCMSKYFVCNKISFWSEWMTFICSSIALLFHFGLYFRRTTVSTAWSIRNVCSSSCCISCEKETHFDYSRRLTKMDYVTTLQLLHVSLTYLKIKWFLHFIVPRPKHLPVALEHILFVSIAMQFLLSLIAACFLFVGLPTDHERWNKLFASGEYWTIYWGFYVPWWFWRAATQRSASIISKWPFELFHVHNALLFRKYI